MRKYDNFCSNLAVLSQASEQDLNNEFIIGGIIDKFFVQFELGWKVLKELLKYEGSSVSASSWRDLISFWSHGPGIRIPTIQRTGAANIGMISIIPAYPPRAPNRIAYANFRL